jgi:excinuclease ABC subunit C
VLPAEAKQFAGFGRCRLWPRIRAATGDTAIGDSLRDARRAVRHLCPSRPGVYGMLDADGEVIYVGKSKSLRHRLISYLQTDPTDPRAARIIRHSVRLVWETAPHELAALLRELELIRRFRPEFNVVGQPGQFRRVYVCLGRGPAPLAYIAPQPGPRAEHVFGPVRSKRVLREAVRRLNTWFRLRDCDERVPILFSDQLTLFDADRAPRCPRHELGTCPAPCAGACTRRAYFQNVAAARQFLDGTNVRLLGRLHRRMRRAAAEREYIRAANWRDIWQPLAWLHEELDGFREARRNYSFVYPVRNGGRSYWLIVCRGQAMRGLRAPHDASSAHRCAARLDQVFSAATGQPDGETDVYDAENVALMIAWFRRRPEELSATLSPAAAQDICRELANAEPAAQAREEPNARPR